MQQIVKLNMPCGSVTGGDGGVGTAARLATPPLLGAKEAVPVPVVVETDVVFPLQGSKSTLVLTGSPLPGPAPLGPLSSPHQLSSAFNVEAEVPVTLRAMPLLRKQLYLIR